MRFVVFCFLVFMAAAAVHSAQAQKQQQGAVGPAVAEVPVVPVEAQKLPDRIARPMVAIDPVTLKAEGLEIRLWGIQPASTSETSLERKALEVLDALIGQQVVNCKIVGGQVPLLAGRCAVQGSTDLALELLNDGLAVRDRRETYDTQFATAYGEAEQLAKAGRKGVWKYKAEAEKTSSVPKWLEPQLDMIVPLAIILGPITGLLIVAFVMWFWLQRMSTVQNYEAEAARKKETTLQSREKNVMLSTLEGELTENKNKAEAFLVIYGDMLRSLKDPSEVPKYQQVGDIVQKHPSFSKTVFEANVGKLSLLGIRLAGQVSRLYSALPKEQEYINLEPTVSLDTAVKLVEKVLREAEEMLSQINTVLQGLQTSAQQKPE